jgi:hypothetical protein
MRHDGQVGGDFEDGGDDPTVQRIHGVERVGARREANAPAAVCGPSMGETPIRAIYMLISMICSC